MFPESFPFYKLECYLQAHINPYSGFGSRVKTAFSAQFWLVLLTLKTFNITEKNVLKVCNGLNSD